MTYGVLRWAIRLVCRVYLVGRFDVRGRDRIPDDGAYVVCANHIGTIDPALVPAWIDRADSWSMAKAEALEGGGIGPRVLRTYHAFGVVRHTADRRAIRRALDILHAGGVLFVYPEGHRGWDGRLQRGEPGAAFLARTARVPVLPVGLVGSNRVLAPGQLLPRRRLLSIRVGEPFRLLDRHPDGARITHQEATDAIMVAIARLLPEEMRGAYAGKVSDEALADLVEPAARAVATGS